MQQKHVLGPRAVACCCCLDETDDCPAWPACRQPCGSNLLQKPKAKARKQNKNQQGETPGYLELRLPLGLALLVPLTLATGAV